MTRKSGGGKESSCPFRRYKWLGFNPCVGKIPWRKKWQPIPYSCLKNPIDRGAWQATVHRVTKSQTRLKTHVLLLLLRKHFKLCIMKKRTWPLGIISLVACTKRCYFRDSHKISYNTLKWYHFS